MSPFVMFTFKLQPPWVGVNVLPAELYPERIRKKSVAVCVLWVKPPEVSGLPEVRCQKTAWSQRSEVRCQKTARPPTSDLRPPTSISSFPSLPSVKPVICYQLMVIRKNE